MGDITISVDTSGLKERIQRMKSQIQDTLPIAVQEMGDTIANAAQVKAPYKTGTLRDSIKTREIQVSGDKCTAVVGPSDDVPYARIQELGGYVPAEEPYIYPVTKKALAFDGGVYARVKRHYIPAHPYMRPAFVEERDNAIEAGKRILLGGLK